MGAQNRMMELRLPGSTLTRVPLPPPLRRWSFPILGRPSHPFQDIFVEHTDLPPPPPAPARASGIGLPLGPAVLTWFLSFWQPLFLYLPHLADQGEAAPPRDTPALRLTAHFLWLPHRPAVPLP